MEPDTHVIVLDALAGGAAIVVANPAPMAYGVVATTARAVNAFKGRPVDQNVAVSVHDPAHRRELEPALDVPRHASGAVAELLRRRFSVLLPVGDTVPPPPWTVPAVRNGRLAIFDGSWDALGWLWHRFPLLYGSSANRTGVPAVGNPRDARAMFGSECLVAAGDERGTEPRISSAMVGIDTAGRIALHRSGAQDQVSGLPPQEFIERLAREVGLRPQDPTD